jgi:GDP-L-fucose synthase
MPTNLYGPGDNYSYSGSHVLPALIRKFWEAKKNSSESVTCWGSGLARREFLHVDDLAEAIIFTLNNWDPSLSNSPRDSEDKELTYLNIGTGKDISIKELANLIANEIGFKGKIEWDTTKPDGTPRKQLDISRILKLGWTPKINLVDGIKESIICFEKELRNNSLRV